MKIPRFLYEKSAISTFVFLVFGCYFSVAKILIFRHVCKFFFQIAKKVVFLQFEIINATRIKIV